MKQMTNLLGLYGGCDSDELRRIRKLPSRWVALCTTFPSLFLYEGGCYLLHGDPDEQVSGKKRRLESGLSAKDDEEGYDDAYKPAGGGGSGGGGRGDSAAGY
jgi:hypothetical protein